jgi:hypothetical protein
MARPYSVDLRERVVACERPPRQLRRRFFSINPKFLLSPNVCYPQEQPRAYDTRDRPNVARQADRSVIESTTQSRM